MTPAQAQLDFEPVRGRTGMDDLVDKHLEKRGDRAPYEVMADMLANYQRMGGHVRDAVMNNMVRGDYYLAFRDATYSSDRFVALICISAMQRMSEDRAVADFLWEALAQKPMTRARLEFWNHAAAEGLDPNDKQREKLWLCALDDEHYQAFEVLKNMDWLPRGESAQDILDRISTGALRLHADDSSAKLKAYASRAALELTSIASATSSVRHVPATQGL